MVNKLVTVGEDESAFTVLMDVEEDAVTEGTEEFDRDEFIAIVREAVSAEGAEVVPMLDRKEANSWRKADLVEYVAKPEPEKEEEEEENA